MTEPFIVGITGGSGAGKTRFLHALMDHFDEGDICLVTQDNYYKVRDQQPKDEDGVINFDLPESIDLEHMQRDLEALNSGKTVKFKEYTFNNPELTPKSLTFHPAPIIVVEGILIFHSREINNLFHLRVFLDAREQVRLARRIIRDREERGYGLDDVLYRYQHHVTPVYEKYIEPLKSEVDIIIPNNNDFKMGLRVLSDHLRAELEKRKGAFK